MGVEQRLERMIYLADEREVYAKYVAEEKVSDFFFPFHILV